MPERIIPISEAKAKLSQPFTHTVIGQVDDYCAYLSYFEGLYRFHKHNKDEMYVVLEGEVCIEFEDSKSSVCLQEGDTLVVKAGEIHRSSSQDGALVLMFKAQDLFAE
jgi:mannose-6-phosphate isomerase-like protein (cupin superfamily)